MNKISKKKGRRNLLFVIGFLIVIFLLFLLLSIMINRKSLNKKENQEKEESHQQLQETKKKEEDIKDFSTSQETIHSLDKEKESNKETESENIDRDSETKGYSDDALIELAKQYYLQKNEELPQHVEIDSQNGEDVLVHFYDVIDDHTDTYDWYTINRNTGIGTDFFGEPIDVN